MKPYVVVVDYDQKIHVEEFENLTAAWDWAIAMNKLGRRAYAAAVLASPEVMLRLDGQKGDPS